MMNMDVIDQKTVNPFVPGSSPGQGAKLCKDFLRAVLFFRLEIFSFYLIIFWSNLIHILMQHFYIDRVMGGI